MDHTNLYDVGLTTIADNTTDPLYVFVSVSADPDAAADAYRWICYRVTVANGSKKFAKHPVSGVRITNFGQAKLLQASAAATYTY